MDDHEFVDYYELLQVGPNASRSVIEAAHRRLLKDAHPDAGGNTKLAQRLNAARDVLLDDSARREYDSRRAANASARSHDASRHSERGSAPPSGRDAEAAGVSGFALDVLGSWLEGRVRRTEAAAAVSGWWRAPDGARWRFSPSGSAVDLAIVDASGKQIASGAGKVEADGALRVTLTSAVGRRIARLRLDPSARTLAGTLDLGLRTSEDVVLQR